MENQAAQLVSGELLGNNYALINIGIKTVPVFPLRIKELCRVFDRTARIDISKAKEAGNEWQMMCELVPYSPQMIEAISHAIVRDERFRRVKLYKVRRELQKCTSEQLLQNFKKVMDLSGAKDFFQCAALMSGAAEIIAKPKETEQ
ncbi:MAG: hypothetical protein WCX48_11160 [Bacteroidales bacterium]